MTSTAKQVLVPGAGGFFGRWIVRALTDAGHRVTGLQRADLDLTDPDQVTATVARAAPDAIVNAAGISSPRAGREGPAACFAANTAGTFNLLEAIRTGAPSARLICLSSAMVYGPGVGDPIAEDDPLAPHSVYAASKLAAELLAGQYVREGRVSVTTLRVFNLIGPGQREDQAAAEFARDVRDALDRGRHEVAITVGDPLISRDFTDVRDGARAVLAALDSPGIFNLCSGRTVSLLSLADTLAALARDRRDPAFAVHLDPDRDRISPGDPHTLCGRPDRLESATGWRPRIPLEGSLADLLFEDGTPGTLG